LDREISAMTPGQKEEGKVELEDHTEMGNTVDQDIRLLGEKKWKSLATNTEEREKLLEKARAHTEAVLMMKLMILKLKQP
jgi:TPP-dependent indolepyruvate ferredoxin oxidoreductase alpha subunit